MDWCPDHLSGGFAMPCAWPDCKNGTPDDRLEMMGPGNPIVWERGFLDSFDGRPRFFWREPNFASWAVAMQLRNYELGRIQRPLHVNKHVYHYTTLPAFKSIVETQELWLSDYAYLNDSSEVNHGLALARNTFPSAMQSLAKEDSLVFENILGLRPNQQPRICVACFSFERDSLTQWKGYGAAAIGIAFGIEPSRFFYEIGHPMETRSAPVIYNDEDKRFLLRTFAHDWASLHRLDRQSNNPAWLHAYETLPRSNFYELLSMFKDSAFRDEREFRFLYQEDPNLFDGKVLIKAPKHFRVAGSLLVPYATTKDLVGSRTRTKKEVATKLDLVDVLIAPHPHAEVAAAGIREFLDTHGYGDVSVQTSQVP